MIFNLKYYYYKDFGDFNYKISKLFRFVMSFCVSCVKVFISLYKNYGKERMMHIGALLNSPTSEVINRENITRQQQTSHQSKVTQEGNAQQQKITHIFWSQQETIRLLELIKTNSSSYYSGPRFWEHIAKTGFTDEQENLIYTGVQCRKRIEYLRRDPENFQSLCRQQEGKSLLSVDFAWIVSMSERFFSHEDVLELSVPSSNIMECNLQQEINPVLFDQEQIKQTFSQQKRAGEEQQISKRKSLKDRWWNDERDALLLQGVKQFKSPTGKIQWKRIIQRYFTDQKTKKPLCSPTKCYNHYQRHLKFTQDNGTLHHQKVASLRKNWWTEKREKSLLEGVSKYKRGTKQIDWEKIVRKYFTNSNGEPLRTTRQCSNHYRLMKRNIQVISKDKSEEILRETSMFLEDPDKTIPLPFPDSKDLSNSTHTGEEASEKSDIE